MPAQMRATQSPDTARVDDTPPIDGSDDDNAYGDEPAVVAYAQWLAEALSGHEKREAALSSEISAVREAAAVGAAAVFELRNAVQAQLDGVLKHVGRLEQDLAATKLELAEVVNDNSTSECNLRGEMDALRGEIESDMDRSRSHFHEMHVTGREVLVNKIEALEKECFSLRQQVDGAAARSEAMREQEQSERNAVAQRLENQLEAGKEETMGYLDKIDKVWQSVMGETSSVRTQLEALHKDQARLDESSRQNAEEVQRVYEHATKFQGQHEKLEPRVYQLEEFERSSKALTERLQDQVKGLLASRYSSPAEDIRSDNRSDNAFHLDEAANQRASGQSAATGAHTPHSANDGGDDNWRFSPTTTVSESSTRGLVPSSGPGTNKTREGPARTSGLASPPPQAQQQAPMRYPMAVVQTLGGSRTVTPSGRTPSRTSASANIR